MTQRQERESEELSLSAVPLPSKLPAGIRIRNLCCFFNDAEQEYSGWKRSFSEAGSTLYIQILLHYSDMPKYVTAFTRASGLHTEPAESISVSWTR